jgi:hypothetical protein
VLIEILALIDAPPLAYLVGDSPLRGPLTRLIRARGLEAVVHLPGWSYEPARDIAQATVHVVPSREESWSQSAVLALGLGVPVVGTAVDGMARTLGEGRSVLVPAEAPRALAGAPSRVLASERSDPALGRACAGSSPPAQRPRYRPAPTASCSPAAPEPGSQARHGLENQRLLVPVLVVGCSPDRDGRAYGPPGHSAPTFVRENGRTGPGNIRF